MSNVSLFLSSPGIPKFFGRTYAPTAVGVTADCSLTIENYK